MKKLIYILVIILGLQNILSCSGNDTDETNINSEYIKSKMFGKWNYWGYKSPSCNCWSYNGDFYKGYFTFTTNNKYTYKNEVSGDIQKGTFSITPATKSTNAYLTLTYQISDQSKFRNIVLKDLTGNQVILFESSFDQRYDKE
jgi:hypothetical protein